MGQTVAMIMKVETENGKGDAEITTERETLR
jgi:hypothetical protein